MSGGSVTIRAILRSERLVTLGGVRALLHRGDMLVWDRWRWLHDQLPASHATVLDAGCGNGSMAINVASLGHDVLGLSFSETELARAVRWAKLFSVSARFEVQDLRNLRARTDLIGRFDVVLCTEVIEHLMDDQMFVSTLSQCLKPGGTLILTTPYFGLHPMFGDEMYPEAVEDGGHVRRGYTTAQLRNLMQQGDLEIVAIAGCSGYVSQRVTSLQRRLEAGTGSALAGWLVTLLGRLAIGRRSVVPLSGCNPGYSICAVARRPG